MWHMCAGALAGVLPGPGVQDQAHLLLQETAPQAENDGLPPPRGRPWTQL